MTATAHTVPGTTSTITITPTARGFEITRTADEQHGIPAQTTDAPTETDARAMANYWWARAIVRRDTPVVPEHSDPCVCGPYDACWGVRVRTMRDPHRSLCD